MNPHLQFDFTVNKENKTVNVTCEFAANLQLVWDAWTKPELLDQWWAPKPYVNKTKSMDFREGGTWLYCMISPEGETHWCLNNYKKIDHLKGFSGLDAFCDEAGNINMDFPRTLCSNTFAANANTTTVSIVAQYEKLEDLEKIIAMGFKEGFTMALGNLDEYFKSLKK